MPSTKPEEVIRDLEDDLKYWIRNTRFQFFNGVRRLIEADPKMNQSRLASMLGIKPSQISKWLNGEENITIESMNKLAAALDAAIYIVVEKRGKLGRWVPLDELREAPSGSSEEMKTESRARLDVPVWEIRALLPTPKRKQGDSPTLTQDFHPAN